MTQLRGKPVPFGRSLLAGTCIASLALMAQPALAQDTSTTAAADQNADDNSSIGDIVVTARYVTENIQDTPIAITAQTQEQLKAANVSNVGTLGAVVPNLYAIPGDSQSAGTPRISMRGIQQGATSSLGNPTAVAFYTDDVYHATAAGSELDFTDVDHIEVNRGPQSTLSGNASLAGSVKILTKDPRGDGSGFIEVRGGQRDRLGMSGAIDLGLSPTLAMRVSGNVERITGFSRRLDFACMMDKMGTPALKGKFPYIQPDSGDHNCVIGHNGGGEFAVGQVKLRWRPTDRLDFIFTARHRQENLEETPEVAPSFGTGCITGVTGPQPCGVPDSSQLLSRAVYNVYGITLDSRFLPPERNGGLYDTYQTDCRPKWDLTVVTPGGTRFPTGFPDGLCYSDHKPAHHTLFSGKVVAEVADNTHLTAIVGHTDYSNEFTQNGDQSPLGYTIAHFINKDKQTTEEVRLDGKLFDGKLQYVVGGFNMKAEGHQNNMLTFLNIFQISKVTGIIKSTSGFAHLDYSITDNWRVSGGARYSDNSLSISIVNPNAISTTKPALSGDKRWDWMLSTDYKITPDVLVYATAATGSRPSGVATIVNTARQFLPVPAEELISYEAGIKADFFDRRLRTNITGFYEDYKSIASSVQGMECRNQPGDVATWYPIIVNAANGAAASAQCSIYPGTPSPVTFNLPFGYSAKIKGVEWEISALPIDGLRLNWSGGYNKFVSGVKTVGQPGYIFPGNYRQPEWNMHADGSYEFESNWGYLTPRLDWNYVSTATFEPSQQLQAPRPTAILPAYSLFNAQVKYENLDKNWSATFQVTNLGNKYYYFQRQIGTYNDQYRVGEPRTWWVTLRREF